MPKDKFNDLDSLLNAAESIQTKMLSLQDDLSKELYVKVLKYYPEINSEKYSTTKLQDLITKLTVQLTHEVQDLTNGLYKDTCFSRK